MMLPATAMRDIMMHNIMSPLLNIFRTNRVERSTASRREDQGGWSREKRRHWWRSLGALGATLARTRQERGVLTEPLQEDHLTLSRRKRTVGLYSYAPWLTNDVR